LPGTLSTAEQCDQSRAALAGAPALSITSKPAFFAKRPAKRGPPDGRSSRETICLWQHRITLPSTDSRKSAASLTSDIPSGTR
jgi:hypothetical protein